MQRTWVAVPAVLVCVLATQLGAPDPGAPAGRHPVALTAALQQALATATEAAHWECTLPHRTRATRPSGRAESEALPFTEPAETAPPADPGGPGGRAEAEPAPQPIPGFGTGPGEKPRGRLTGSLTGTDAVDTFSFPLRAGDVFAATTRGSGGALEVRDPAGTLVEGSTVDRSGIYPDASPLLGGGNATVDHVAAVTGTHTLTIRRAPPAGAPAPVAPPPAARGPAMPAPAMPAPAQPAPAQPGPAKPATPPVPAAPAALPTTTPAAPAPDAARPGDQGPAVVPETAMAEAPETGSSPPGAADTATPAPTPPPAPAPVEDPEPRAPGAPSTPDGSADSAYVTDVGIFRPDRPAAQRIVLEFGGARVDMRRFGVETANPSAELSPLSSYLKGWDLGPADEAALVSRVTATVRDNLSAATGGGQVDITSAAGPGGSTFGQPGVSRVVVGGSAQEVGVATVGISESVDPGNFAREETALVLLDRLSGPATSGPTGDPAALARYLPAQTDRTARIEFVGRALGNIVSHEAGHFLGSWHTDPKSGKHDVMAPGDIAGAFTLGPDLIRSTADDLRPRFGQDAFDPELGLIGTQDSRNRTATALDGVPAPADRAGDVAATRPVEPQ